MSISTTTPVTSTAGTGHELRLPINHFEGNYTCSPDTLAELRAEDRIVFRYVDNPNGSIDDIAGVCSAGRNVVGLMPHPERAYHPLLGSTDGRVAAWRASLAAAARAAATSQRLIPACLSTLAGHAGLAPRRVADAPALAVALGRLHEVRLELGEVDLVVHGRPARRSGPSAPG